VANFIYLFEFLLSRCFDPLSDHCQVHTTIMYCTGWVKMFFQGGGSGGFRGACAECDRSHSEKILSIFSSGKRSKNGSILPIMDFKMYYLTWIAPIPTESPTLPFESRPLIKILDPPLAPLTIEITFYHYPL
jgi:hypothetical protein